MSFNPGEIAGKEFLVTLRGYDRAEVREFLRAVADDMANLRADLEASRDHLASVLANEPSGSDPL